MISNDDKRLQEGGTAAQETSNFNTTKAVKVDFRMRRARGPNVAP